MRRFAKPLAALLLAAAPALVRADVINFSGLSTNNVHNPAEAPIPDGYAGFNWANFSSLNPSNDPTATPSGYSHADTDSASPSVGFNLFGRPASISSATDFSFYGAFFTAAWRDGMKVEVSGYNGGQLLYDKKFTINSTAPTFAAFDFEDIDKLTFSTTFGPDQGLHNGTAHGYVPGAPHSHPPGTQFAIDDLIFIRGGSGISPDGGGVLAGAPTHSAPEPAGLLLFAVGGAAVGVAAWGRRRFAAA